MGGSGKRGDRVLESRHLVGLFLCVVVLGGEVFTLGYVMGRTQDDSSVHASDRGLLGPSVSPKSGRKPAVAEKTPAPNSGEWDFYSKKPNDDRLEPVPKPKTVADSPRAIRAQERRALADLPRHVRPPRLLKNEIVLQVAALRHQGDALALANALQQRRFPSFVLTPTADSYYRVQVGPYATEAAAEKARRELDHQGFKSIIKR